MKTNGKILIDDLVVNYSFLYSATADFFKDYLVDVNTTFDELDIKVDHDYLIENKWLVNQNNQSDATLEFLCLMLSTGNELLLHRKALFHAVAVKWNGLAWIITAPSGTGKTTQLRNWRSILKKNIQIINGDKPFISCHNNGDIWIYSSPWRGKEKLGEAGSFGKLGGIILLEQGKKNEIIRLDPEDAVLPLLAEFVSYPENIDQIKGEADILNSILDAVPVWKLTNLGDLDSSQLTIETITKYMEDRR